MSELVLGFRAFDPHELLVHAVAAREGLYAAAGLHVRLRDLTFDPESAPPLQVACGAATLAAEAGVPVRVALVCCERPLFWLVGSERGRVASFPPGSPPARFLERLRPDLVQEPARDDAARLGLLREGHVDAALVSSAAPPPRLGLPEVAWLGAELRTPTSGLAASERLLAEQGDTVERLVQAHRESLRLVLAGAPAARAALGAAFGYTEDEADWLLSLGAFGTEYDR